MVEIQCPSCEADIELEDGVFGLFDCPVCGEEFSWDNDDEVIDDEVIFSLESDDTIAQSEDSMGLRILKFIVKGGLFLSAALFLLAILSGIIIMITDGGYAIFLSLYVGIIAIYIFLGTIVIGFIGLIIYAIVESSKK